jgi:hypothetical protein
VSGTFNTRAVIAVLLAGVAGTIVNAAAVALVVSADLWTLALVPGRYVVAVALCLALPVLARQVDRLWFIVIGTVWLAVAPTVLAKLLFGVEAPWLTVLGFNVVYAIAAMVVYGLIAKTRAKEA